MQDDAKRAARILPAFIPVTTVKLSVHMANFSSCWPRSRLEKTRFGEPVSQPTLLLWEHIENLRGFWGKARSRIPGQPSQKIERKKDSALLLFFFFSFLKSGWLCDLTPQRTGCLKRKTSPQFTWRCGRTYDFVQPKFLRCIDNQIFLLMVLRCTRSKNSTVSD